MSIIEKIEKTVSYLKEMTSVDPSYGIILGTGLGGLIHDIDIETTVDYEDVPNFVSSTVESHKGKLIFGYLEQKPIVAMQGRFHFYEGYSMEEITFPVRVLHRLGIHSLFVSNAAGCLNQNWKKGDLMVITDHINLLGQNPLIGYNNTELGPRFPDMSEPYSQELIKLAQAISSETGQVLRYGVYASMTGPSLETRAEYRMLQIIGADAIGMSTVPEVIVANHQGLSVFGISILTDECFPESLKPVNINEILSIAEKAEPKMTELIKRMVGRLS